jgi:hypothetical protein
MHKRFKPSRSDSWPAGERWCRTGACDRRGSGPRGTAVPESNEPPRVVPTGPMNSLPLFFHPYMCLSCCLASCVGWTSGSYRVACLVVRAKRNGTEKIQGMAWLEYLATSKSNLERRRWRGRI